MQFLFELILLPIFEFVAHFIGYATACVIVPVFTLGQVGVAPSRARVQLSAETAVWVGLLFWALVVVLVVWLRSCNASS